jgi:hypothetical protein
MKSLTHIFTKGLLLAAVFSIAAAGVIAATSAILGQSSSAAAQEMANTTNTTTATNATQTAANNATETASSATTGNNTLAGIIASLQLNEQGAPQWVTAGYWKLESDQPLFGGNSQSEPMVTSFDAVVDMAQISNGTSLHGHTFSNFSQSDITFTPDNATAINGTMTVTTEDGPTEDVPAYITLHNNLITIYPNPGAVENHFGPTPINGLILTPEKIQEISDLLLSTTGSGGGGGTEAAAGQQNSTSSTVTSDIGNATGQ